MLVIQLVTSLLLIGGLVIGKDFKITHKSELRYIACGTLLSNRHEDLHLFCDLNNQPALGSMAHCLTETFRYESENYMQEFLDFCNNLTLDDFLAAYDNATLYLRDHSDARFGADQGPPYPIMVRPDEVAQLQEVLYTHSLTDNWSIWYGTILLCYWLLIMLFSGIHYWGYFLFPDTIHAMYGKATNLIRRHFILPPLFSRSHVNIQSWTRWFVWLIPLRFEMLVLAGHLILVTIFSSTHVYMSRYGFVALSVGSRTGSMAVFMVPLLVLFAGRNNFTQWLTGWSYSRFLIFHRYIARIMFLILIAHVASKTITIRTLGSYVAYMKRGYMKWAVVAATCAGLLIFHSLQVFRQASYEIFLILHNLLAVFFLIGGWKHTKYVGAIEFFYAASAVWVFDKLLRLVRIILFGRRRAVVQLTTDETLRLTVLRPHWWNPYPGCHAFIYFMDPRCFWQSHPFSVIDSIDEGNTITFFLKIKHGITERLRTQLLNSPTSTLEIKVLVEGPYGQRDPLHKFERVVLLSGGNGILGVFYHALDLSRNRNSSEIVRLYWIIHHYKSIGWFYNELLKLRGTNVEIIIYVCHPELNLDFEIYSPISMRKSDSESDTNLQEKDNINSAVVPVPDLATDTYSPVQFIKENLAFVEFRNGRPDIAALVNAEVQDCVQNIAFATCGNACMVDDARVAVVENIGRERLKRIDLFEIIEAW